MLSIALSFWTVKKKADFLASNDRLMIEKKFYLFKAIEKIDPKKQKNYQENIIKKFWLVLQQD